MKAEADPPYESRWNTEYSTQKEAGDSKDKTNDEKKECILWTSSQRNLQHSIGGLSWI